jgi:hypothetical protein
VALSTDRPRLSAAELISPYKILRWFGDIVGSGPWLLVDTFVDETSPISDSQDPTPQLQVYILHLGTEEALPVNLQLRRRLYLRLFEIQL